MLEILKFALEGGVNFFGVLILSTFWGALIMTMIDKFKPINITYITRQEVVKEKEENINE